jgi:hypothetical protein
MLLASLAVAAGLILDSVARGRREAKRLAYLAAGAQAPAYAQAAAAARPEVVPSTSTARSR